MATMITFPSGKPFPLTVHRPVRYAVDPLVAALQNRRERGIVVAKGKRRGVKVA